VLWGNVSINVLLTILSGSVLTGVSAFLFSTIVITFLGEIFPQAYFSRNALLVASKLTPVIKFYQILLFPVAKLTALILDGWLGKEGITYLREKQLAAIIKAHIDSDDTDMEQVQGRGALNFLQVENITVVEEGELLDPDSIITMPSKLDFPILPPHGTAEFNQFIKQVDHSGHKWVLIQSEKNEPLLMLDADGFVRSTTKENEVTDPYSFCHRPIVITDPTCTLGEAMQRLKSVHDSEPMSDAVLHTDVIVVWTDMPHRVITGADILGRLLRGIGQEQHV
jgi:CBS domain containing-hemolysin-like protein